MLSQRLDTLSRELIRFWVQQGVDREHGGFHGTLDRAGAPKAPTDKGLVQQARHLWTFSTWHELREPTNVIRQIADDTYAFMIRHMRAADGEFVFKVSRDGARRVESKKQLYAQSFAIYALATYGRALGVDTALEQSLDCFRSIERLHDARYGGYDQSADPGWLTPGAQKETNTHIHLLEAFTELHRATGDTLVRERLSELARVTATALYQSGQHYVHREFLRDFTPVGAARCSYGHDIETAWLLLDAARELDATEHTVLLGAALGMARHASDAGFDPVHGGFFEEGPMGGDPDMRAKVWWVQAEALIGLLELYVRTGESRHLARLERTLAFIERYLRDPEHGEWYWQTNEDGTASPRGTDKGEEWKASYHSVRALLFTQERLAAVGL